MEFIGGEDILADSDPNKINVRQTLSNLELEGRTTRRQTNGNVDLCDIDFKLYMSVCRVF